ncbi:hypothetical protein SPLC1_S590150 [Arthrospira platensis C1]|nr:hypothetical protein SPLC1_S590150 [Arthrospira platensis C1]
MIQIKNNRPVLGTQGIIPRWFDPQVEFLMIPFLSKGKSGQPWPVKSRLLYNRDSAVEIKFDGFWVELVYHTTGQISYPLVGRDLVVRAKGYQINC